MSEQKKGKKRPKSYYLKCAAGGKKLNKSLCIEPGMKGFLVTCNKYERETVREMYNLLSEYADKLYGPEKIPGQAISDHDNSSDEEDMEKAMAKETAALKKESTLPRRFQNTNTKTKNVIFIRTTVEDPCHLAHCVFQDMLDNQIQKARYAQRIIPVSVICKVDSKAIETAIHSVLAPHFETEFGVGIKYTAICKIRNNNCMSRNILLPLMNRIIQEMNPLHKLCHGEPDLVILIEILRAVCCLSVVKDFFKFRKYNFHEIIRKTEQNEPNESEVKNVGEDEEKSENVVSVEVSAMFDNVVDTHTDEVSLVNADDAHDDLHVNEHSAKVIEADGDIGDMKEVSDDSVKDGCNKDLKTSKMLK